MSFELTCRTSHEDAVFRMPFLENPYTSDEASFQEIIYFCQQHSDLMMGGASLGWVNAAFRSVNDLWKKRALDEISIPVLIATGGDDGIIDVSYHEEFANRLKISKHVYYPEGRHELFRETQEIKNLWWNDFDEFFNRITLFQQHQTSP